MSLYVFSVWCEHWKGRKKLLYISTFNLAPNRYTFAQSSITTHFAPTLFSPTHARFDWFKFVLRVDESDLDILIILFLGEKSCWSRCSCCTIWFTFNIWLWRKQFDNWRSLFDWFRARFGRFRSWCKLTIDNPIELPDKILIHIFRIILPLGVQNSVN